MATIDAKWIRHADALVTVHAASNPWPVEVVGCWLRDADELRQWGMALVDKAERMGSDEKVA